MRVEEGKVKKNYEGFPRGNAKYENLGYLIRSLRVKNIKKVSKNFQTCGDSNRIFPTFSAANISVSEEKIE